MKEKSISKINSKNIDKIFPNKYTKIRPEDLIRLSGKKNINISDKQKLINIADTLFEKQIGTDYLAVKNKNGVDFIKL